VLAYKYFCDKLTKEQAKECCLLLHTQRVDNNGTDLPELIKNVCPDYDVKFTDMKFETDGLNLLYNLADVTVNIASNEGFGLATCESMKAGTPIVVNVTGGLQDQCGFKVNGVYLTADDYVELGSLHDDSNRPDSLEWGRWVTPVWPSNRSLQGSPATPYIFDDRCRFEDVGDAFIMWYSIGENERKQFGLEGSEFVHSADSNMSSDNMGELFVEAMEGAFNNFKPRNEIVLCKI